MCTSSLWWIALLGLVAVARGEQFTCNGAEASYLTIGGPANSAPLAAGGVAYFLFYCPSQVTLAANGSLFVQATVTGFSGDISNMSYPDLPPFVAYVSYNICPVKSCFGTTIDDGCWLSGISNEGGTVPLSYSSSLAYRAQEWGGPLRLEANLQPPDEATYFYVSLGWTKNAGSLSVATTVSVSVGFLPVQPLGGYYLWESPVMDDEGSTGVFAQHFFLAPPFPVPLNPGAQLSQITMQLNAVPCGLDSADDCADCLEVTLYSPYAFLGADGFGSFPLVPAIVSLEPNPFPPNAPVPLALTAYSGGCNITGVTLSAPVWDCNCDYLGICNQTTSFCDCMEGYTGVYPNCTIDPCAAVYSGTVECYVDNGWGTISCQNYHVVSNCTVQGCYSMDYKVENNTCVEYTPKGTKVGLIVGIVLLSLLLVLAAPVCLLLYCRTEQRADERAPLITN